VPNFVASVGDNCVLSWAAINIKFVADIAAHGGGF